MGTVVVDVMLKPEILDPQGQAVAGALPRLGFAQFNDVRQGKRFTLEVEGPVTPQILAQAREAAQTLLSNPVIEDVVSVRDAETGETAYDWEDEGNPESWGAIAPIPEGAGRHEGRARVDRGNLSAEQLQGAEGTAAYKGDDD
ncbi:phosphoribosylformylglycinamidine synthase, purS protein [Austwickia chelonae]|uniref:Phosphoribosylformylglycinamidine synthase subunit PurS n=1 Tax=Austwickia chelonae NBRC 105200 TaxID=1184607 RepID=K6WAV7_9MICO|nr:phosphoribosylformylglycinamidine synthase PurS [Austwickia chelonae NBRC 105200]SEV87673.1 phosphoribosylformylglycinamidine synthase, purS protein [Austwickia chelonae]